MTITCPPPYWGEARRALDNVSDKKDRWEKERDEGVGSESRILAPPTQDHTLPVRRSNQGGRWESTYGGVTSLGFPGKRGR